MEVIIELSPETSQQFQAHDQSTPVINQLMTTIAELDVIIKPQYRNEELRNKEQRTENYFFVIETKDWEECQRIATVLGHLPAVKAAYCKPEAEPASLP
jgi:hypothetical protein